MRVGTLLFISCIMLCVTSCWTPPGKGWKARDGYRRAAPVIVALEKFHDDQGHYPENLNELTPKYVASPPAFLYRRDGDSYSLSFTYFGPGVNDCIYDSQSKAWRASGYY